MWGRATCCRAGSGFCWGPGGSTSGTGVCTNSGTRQGACIHAGGTTQTAAAPPRKIQLNGHFHIPFTNFGRDTDSLLFPCGRMCTSMAQENGSVDNIQPMMYIFLFLEITDYDKHC